MHLRPPQLLVLHLQLDLVDFQFALEPPRVGFGLGRAGGHLL
jgi:hypothetical protein